MRHGVVTAALLSAVLVSCAPAAGPAVAPTTAASFELPQLAPTSPIPAAEYAARRRALAGHMQDGVLLVMGEPETEHDYLPFAQAFDFRYLTGVMEPGAALVIVKDGAQLSEHLFVLPRNPEREVWEGARLGAEGATALTRIPSQPVARLPVLLDSVLRLNSRLYTTADPPEAGGLLRTLSPEQQVVERLRTGHPSLQVIAAAPWVEGLRAVKSDAELDLIRRAVQISVLAHRAAMRTVQPGMNEFEIQALVEYYFRRNGAERPAYASIVGSGPNSTTLHYRAADRFMQENEVLLIDVGASYRGYAADLTRTLPVNGRFTTAQREIYQIVLDAQKAAEAAVRRGVGWQELNAAAERVLADGLARLGLIDSPTATYRCQSARFGVDCPQYRLYYMHGLGHGIGLAVHDPEISYSAQGFQVGSAFTIEPGIYVRADALDYLPDTPENREMAERLRPVVRRYQNIGVRIEDDYILTAGGLERVSAALPREIAEVEALMRQPGLDPERRQAVVEWYRATQPR